MLKERLGGHRIRVSPTPNGAGRADRASCRRAPHSTAAPIAEFECVHRAQDLSDLTMAGLFIVHQEGTALSRLIDDLILLDDCSDNEEWIDQITYLPLR